MDSMALIKKLLLKIDMLSQSDRDLLICIYLKKQSKILFSLESIHQKKLLH